MQQSKGFTLLELLVSVGIMGILFGFSSWAYLNVQKNSDLSNQTSQLVNSIRQAQSYAMTGQTTDQENQLNMGINLRDNSYTLFYGSDYNPDDPKNITTNLPSGIILSADLPSANLVFSAISGEVENYGADHNSVTITHSDGNSHVITINQLGVVDLD